jgi:hypothetical protein
VLAACDKWQDIVKGIILTQPSDGFNFLYRSDQRIANTSRWF